MHILRFTFLLAYNQTFISTEYSVLSLYSLESREDSDLNI
jgi:hypothetical protein